MPAASQTRRLEALKAAPLDAWIALTDNDELVATGATYDEEVVKKTEAAGVADPIVIKTPKEWSSFSLGQTPL